MNNENIFSLAAFCSKILKRNSSFFKHFMTEGMDRLFNTLFLQHYPICIAVCFSKKIANRYAILFLTSVQLLSSSPLSPISSEVHCFKWDFRRLKCETCLKEVRRGSEPETLIECLHFPCHFKVADATPPPLLAGELPIKTRLLFLVCKSLPEK